MQPDAARGVTCGVPEPSLPTSTAEPAAGRLGFCRVGQHRIAYIAHNEHLTGDTPLVFVHGFSMSVRFWEIAMLPEIKQHRRWYSVSLPLHFPSTYDGDPLAAMLPESAFAKTLGDTVTQLVGRTPVRVVGHSVGAFAALAFAVAYPAQCEAVMSIGGFAQGRAEGLRGGLQFLRLSGRVGRGMFRSIWRAQQRSRWFMRRLVSQYAADQKALSAYPPLEPTLRLVHPDVAQHPLDGQYNMVRWLLDLDVEDDAHNIHCPVWVIAGTHDPVVAYDHQRRYAELLPAGELFPLHGAGHLGFAERPKEFNDLLRMFAATADGAFFAQP